MVGEKCKNLKNSIYTFQKHHVIPNKVYKEFAEEFRDIGFKQDVGMNLKRLPTPFHGNHPAYNRRVRQGILDLKGKRQLTPEGIQDLQHQLRQEINDIYLNGQWERLNPFYKSKEY